MLGLWALATSARAQGPAVLEQTRRCQEAPRPAAVAACREALRLGLPPARAEVVRKALAASLIALDRGAEAVGVYREAVALRPDDAEAQLRLGRALLLVAGDAEGAVAALEAALRLSPQSAEAYGLLGTAQLALGHVPEAAAAFTEAQRLDPKYFELRPASLLAYEAAQRGGAWP
jgi:tetratricopeptide (TPR) repeat protein